jgi:hypothetical protein
MGSLVVSTFAYRPVIEFGMEVSFANKLSKLIGNGSFGFNRIDA